ncbi:MAG: AMP-binding protein [Acidimicrobiia bacterium]
MTDLIGMWRWAEAEPDRRAVVDAEGNEYTFADMACGANRTLHGLRAAGMNLEDNFAVVLPNSKQWWDFYFAAVQGGLYFTPLNYHLTPSEVSYVLNDAEVKLFVAHERFGAVAKAAAEQAGLPLDRCYAVGHIDGFRPVSDLLDGQPGTRPNGTTPGDRMMYTSGTTGKPKGIRRPLSKLSVDELWGRDASTRELYGYKLPDAVHLLAGPLYHSAPNSVAVGAMHSGHTVVMMDKWAPEETLRLIEAYRVRTSHMVPTMFHRLLQLPDDVKYKYDLSSLARIVHGAAPVSRHVKRRMIDWWGPILFEYFGSTEVSGTGVMSDDWLARPGTVGKPWEGTEVRIVDDDGNDCPPNVAGRIFMRSLQPIFEYHKSPEKTEASRMGNWITVGDIGYLDDEGWLFPVDRETNMIISGGVNIYPAETEAVFLEHDAVGDVAVFGVPNDEWGEEVKAVVELRDGFAPSEALAAELIEFSRSRIAHFKCPRSVDFRVDLPRAANGKLYKRLIREEFWQGRDSRIL